jgi:N-acetylglucosaminyl-diphospho-decaprenol L-rhamnosyltransferase
MKSVCLAILNYNGRKHLEHLLPTAVTAARAYAGSCSVVVLDNRSTDDDVKWIQRNHPAVRCVVAPQNEFLFSYNWLLPQLLEEVVVILNNDLRLDEHSLAPLLRHFSAPDVFAVSASSYDWGGNERTIGPARIKYSNGFYGWYYEPARQELCHTLFASGGFMAVDRAKFLELGGFNPLFYPAYCEDLDLGFRAWRRGWRSIYEPASVVWHREQASWKVSPNGEPNTLNLRNSLLFQWSSLPMERDRSLRAWTVTKLLLGELIQGRRTWWRAYPRALRDWARLRADYAALKVSQQELDAIRSAVDAPLPAHGS